MTTFRRPAILGLVAVVAATIALAESPRAVAQAPTCAPGGDPVVMTGSASSADAKTYRLLPFDVAEGTTRVEVGYSWADASPLPSTPLTQSVVDLGLWDADGYRTPSGFRGWSGSRQGKTAEGQDPVFVQADAAERGYVPGRVEPGTWHVEAGIAAVGPAGLTYEITIACSDPATGPAPEPDPVDATHVARTEPGWYAGDFHMHGYHSHPNAPEWDAFVDHARAAGLDFLPVTEYVTTRHHAELGAVQRANPDLVIWPGREVITYFGHATVFGETPSTVEYRHGLEDISLAQIQADTVADGALFGIAHPTIFPGPVFANFCRGCEFTLDGVVDWTQVTTMEVVTGPLLVSSEELGLPDLPVQIMNPFILTALDQWQAHLRSGHRITAVSGSDDKLGPELGANATRVYATELSRPAIVEGLRSGRAYIQTQGTDGPTLDFTADGADGSTGTIGDTLPADTATATVTLTGAQGQVLLISRDGYPAGVAPITADPFTHTFEASASSGSGPLGTFWRVDVLDPTIQALTLISNPIYLGPSVAPAPPTSEPPPVEARPGQRTPADLSGGGSIPTTGGTVLLWLALALVAAAAPLRSLRR